MGENLNKTATKVFIVLSVMLAVVAVGAWGLNKLISASSDEVISGWQSEDSEEESTYETDEEAYAPSDDIDDTTQNASDRLEEKDVYINRETSYRVVIEDDAMLLDEEKRQELAVFMQDITAYGNAAFKTIDSNDFSTEFYARQYYTEQFGTESGTLFLIDMDNRNIWIHSDGAVYKVITKSYANVITDNVYRRASDGDYYECASEAFEQIAALLKGDKIARPMKYINNILLAVILALLLNFGLVSFFARLRKPSRKELLGSAENHFRYTQPEAVFVRESHTYNPVSSGSSSGSGGGGSSGGGSSSGGGGGHRF